MSNDASTSAGAMAPISTTRPAGGRDSPTRRSSSSMASPKPMKTGNKSMPVAPAATASTTDAAPGATFRASSTNNTTRTPANAASMAAKASAATASST